MSNDPTENVRRLLIEAGAPQADLEQARLAQRREWTTAELCRDFDVIGFAAPFVIVRKLDTGEKGTLEFTHSPRVYFDWKPDEPSLGIPHRS